MTFCADCTKLCAEYAGAAGEVRRKLPLPVCAACAPVRAEHLRRVYRFDEIAAAHERLKELATAVHRADVLPLMVEDKRCGWRVRKGQEAAHAFAARRDYGQGALTVLSTRLRFRKDIEADPWIHVRPVSATWLTTPISVELRAARAKAAYLTEAGIAFVRELDATIEEFEKHGY